MFTLMLKPNLRHQLRAALPWLRAQLPQLRVITANIQPVHMAIMEGETEIYLTDQQALAERFNDVPLWIRPQSFLSDQPTIASRLRICDGARDWVGNCRYAYVGCFFAEWADSACTARRRGMQLTGIESRRRRHCLREAIRCRPPSFSRRWIPLNSRHRPRRNARHGIGESLPPRHWQTVVRYLAQMARVLSLFEL